MLEYNDREPLAQDLLRLLSKTPGLTKFKLLELLDKGRWPEITTSNINSVLYGTRSPFRHSDDTLPRWYAVGSISIGQIFSPPLPQYYEGLEPRTWQKEAFDAWRLAGRMGVIEAVTGTGKTTVGILAAADAVARGLRVLVIVPGLVLLNQWYEKLQQDLPELGIGRFGGTWTETLDDHHIIVSTVQSAYKRRILPYGLSGLLIADEVHRYGAEKYAAVLREEFGERLGLTATYEREDEGIPKFLTRYFRPTVKDAKSEIIAGCSYARGLEDGILAPFKIALVGVQFSDDEREEYEELSKKVSKYRTQLVNDFDCPSEPFGEFMRAVSKLNEGNNPNSEMTRCARLFLSAFTKRRTLLAGTTAKIESLKVFTPALNRSEGALIFTETVEGAKLAAATLSVQGIAAYEYTSEMSREQREEVLDAFSMGEIQAISAPRVLDEGIDLPDADMGVIIAASRSRRQMIQRMGRIIRPKNDGRPANFIILYVKDTSEDPKRGAHEAFLSEMMDTAVAYEYFEFYDDPLEDLMAADLLLNFLSETFIE